MSTVFDAITNYPCQGDEIRFAGGRLSYKVVRYRSDTGWVRAKRHLIVGSCQSESEEEIPLYVWGDLVKLASVAEHKPPAPPKRYEGVRWVTGEGPDPRVVNVLAVVEGDSCSIESVTERELLLNLSDFAVAQRISLYEEVKRLDRLRVARGE